MSYLRNDNITTDPNHHIFSLELYMGCQKDEYGSVQNGQLNCNACPNNTTTSGINTSIHHCNTNKAGYKIETVANDTDAAVAVACPKNYFCEEGKEAQLCDTSFVCESKVTSNPNKASTAIDHDRIKIRNSWQCAIEK